MGDLHKRVVVIFGVTVLGGFPERPSDGDYAHPTCLVLWVALKYCRTCNLHDRGMCGPVGRASFPALASGIASEVASRTMLSPKMLSPF